MVCDPFKPRRERWGRDPRATTYTVVERVKTKKTEELIHMPKISDHQEFLNSTMISDGDLVVIADAGEFKAPSVTGLNRVVFHIGVTLPDGRFKIWSCNKTSQGNLAKAYGDDTAGWVKKQVTIKIVPQNVRGEMKDVLYGFPVEADASPVSV